MVWCKRNELSATQKQCPESLEQIPVVFWIHCQVTYLSAWRSAIRFNSQIQ